MEDPTDWPEETLSDAARVAAVAERTWDVIAADVLAVTPIVRGGDLTELILACDWMEQYGCQSYEDRSAVRAFRSRPYAEQVAALTAVFPNEDYTF